jgi:uncharacterized membrane protein
MPNWEPLLKRWQSAGLVDEHQAERIKAFEASQRQSHSLRWPVLLAVGFGALLLGAGLLLFVAAHWDRLSPAERFAIVLGMLAACHGAAALASERFAAASSALHAVGTVALGAGIFLAGQFFHLQSHWPAAVLMWAAGAMAAWAILRDWPQAALTAILLPAWLGSEWVEATSHVRNAEAVLGVGLLNLCITYLSAPMPGRGGHARTALTWIGAICLLPLAAYTAAWGPAWNSDLTRQELSIGLGLALVLPLALAMLLRGASAWMNALAALWVIVITVTGPLSPWLMRHRGDDTDWNALGRYALYALGAIGLVAWGLKEARKERVNLGVAGFAITVLAFYFSTVMDKLGRSASLIGLGLLFLLGGWGIEQTRRRLIARMEGGA